MNSLSNKKQIYFGIIFSYCLIAFNALYSLLLTPFIVSYVGEASYGVYKTIAAFSATLMIVDLGLGNTTQRYVSRFLAEKSDKKLIRSFVALMFFEAFIIVLVASILLLFLYLNIGYIYSKGLNSTEIESARSMFLVLSLTVIIHLFENVASGTIAGHNKFFILNGLKLLRILFRFFFTFVGLILLKNVMVLCLVDLFLTIILFFIEMLYIFFGIKVVPLFSKDLISRQLFKESLGYSGNTFISEIVNQINGNVDAVIIGAFISSSSVTIYSISIIIFAMFEQVASTVSSVLLPRVTDILVNSKGNIINYIIKIGRMQFVLVGAILGGFIVLGKSFLEIWMGSGYNDSYYIAIILMIPAIFELCVNVCLTVLRATNRLLFRTRVLFFMLIINLIITIFGVYYFGYYFAAIGTAISCFVGNIIIMNLYYYKEFGFNMLNVYRQIFKGTWLCIVISSVIAFASSIFITNLYISFVVGAFSFVISYLIGLFVIGLNNDEKEKIVFFLFRRRKKEC